MSIDPNRIYKDEKYDGNVYPVKQFSVTVPSGSADFSVVALVAGKEINVVQLNAKAVTAHTTFALRSKPAGASSRIFSDWCLFQVRNFWKSKKLGLCKTVAGETLTCTTGATGDIELSGKYIEMNPE